MTYVKYVCYKCEAVDTDKLFPNEAPAPMIDCWKCHAGQGKSRAEMFQSNIGMFLKQGNAE